MDKETFVCEIIKAVMINIAQKEPCNLLKINLDLDELTQAVATAASKAYDSIFPEDN